MIIGDELRAWAADRQRLRQARLAADRVATGWGRGEAHRRFERSLEQVEAPRAEAVVEVVRRLFEDDGWVDQLIDTLAAEMRRDPYFEPPFRHINSDVHSGLIVYEDHLVSIAAGATRAGQLAARKQAPRGRTSVMLSGQVGLFKFVRAGAARLSFWQAPTITDTFSAATAGRCLQVGERRIRDGEILVVDGRRQGFVIEHARSNILLLQATVKPDQAPLNVEYDSSTGEYVGCSAADDSASRIQMITTLLRKLDCREAFGAMAEFLSHPSFFVRWHVMRELLGIDLLAALPHLKRMASSDPHPETRRAALTVLSRVENLERKAA